MVVGAAGATVNGNVDQGAAYVFVEPGSGWVSMTETAELTASNGNANDEFGSSVAISGNTVVVGAPASRGYAYVFTEPAAGWTTMTQTAQLTASDSGLYGDFGGSVSISGSTVVVGASGWGAAYVFTEPASGWDNMAETDKLTEFDGATADDFACSVSISGDTVLIGAKLATIGLNHDQGEAFVFEPGLGVTGVSSPESFVSCGVGTTIPITVTFSTPVTVTGTPQLALNAGNGAVAVYASGSGTTTLTFSYIIAAGQSTSDLDISSTSALELDGGTIQDASGNAVGLTLPMPGADGLAGEDIAVGLLSEGFESGNFNAMPWQYAAFAGSETGGVPPDATSWFVQSTTVHSGSFAAQSGAVVPGGSSTLRLTVDEQAGELSFWQSLTSADGAGGLIFEIDGTVELQLSGTLPWQQSFFWVSAGVHTFSWTYGKGAKTPTGNDFADLDDIQYSPGATLTIDGTSGSDDFSFDASGQSIVVALNGEVQTFPAGEFSNYIFVGQGGSDTAFLTGGSEGTNYAALYADGNGQMTNSTEGFAVELYGMTSIHVSGNSADVAQFFDAPGNDTYYAYADYGTSGETAAGMYGSGCCISASGFGTNVAYATSGGSDTAYFFDSPGNDTFYAYADYGTSGEPSAGMYGGYGGGYANSANGFVTNVAYATNGGSDTAYFFDSPGNDTYYAYADYNNTGKPSAGMYGSYGGASYADAANGFATNVGDSSNGGSDTAYFFDSPQSDTYYAYADYGNTGKPSAGMYGGVPGTPGHGGYANSANGFAANVGYSTDRGSDTAYLYSSPSGNDTFYAYAYDEALGGPTAGMFGAYGGGYASVANGFATNIGNAVNGGGDTAYFYDSPGNDTFYAYGDYNNTGEPSAGMYGGVPGTPGQGGGYFNVANGFGTNVGYSTAGGSDTAYLYDSPGNDTFYAYANYNNTGQTSACMYGPYGGGFSSSGHRLCHGPRLFHGRWQRHGLPVRQPDRQQHAVYGCGAGRALRQQLRGAGIGVRGRHGCRRPGRGKHRHQGPGRFGLCVEPHGQLERRLGR